MKELINYDLDLVKLLKDNVIIGIRVRKHEFTRDELLKFIGENNTGKEQNK